ncbi:MAG: PAS domain S-box protein [Fibrobacterota bacterium]|nr:PAS domain S-box protein [Fibrobacterota bacterium]
MAPEHSNQANLSDPDNGQSDLGGDFNLRLLESIRLLQSRFIANHDLREIFNQFILEILRLTSSEYAFVGEVLQAPDGHPYLKVHDISHIARDEATRAFFEGHAPAGLEFHNLNNLFGRAILDKKPVIANIPRQDPRWGGRQPAGHPPMHNFLGLPLMLEDEVIGLVGLANCPGGYEDALVEKLQPVLSSCVAIIDSHRNYRRRIKAEQDLQDSSRLFQALVEKSSEATIVLSEGKITYTSPSSTAILGYSHEDWKALSRFSLVHPEDDGETRKTFARLLSGESREETLEIRVRRKSGEFIWVEIHLTAHLDDPAIKGVVSIYRDISARKKAELDLLLIEERLHLAVEAGKLGTWFIEAPFDRILMNERCCEQFGWAPRQVVDFEEFYSKLHPDDREPTRFIVAEAIAARREYDTFYRVVPKAGDEPRWLRAIGKIFYDDHGNPSRFYGVCIDVTESRRNEDLMRQSQKMEAIGRLAGGIAHDFNNLLTAINGYSEMCLSRVPPGEAIHSHLTEIRKSGDRAAALTHQLLAYSRQQVLMPRLIGLNHLVKDMDHLLTRLIGEDIRIRVDLEEDAGLVKVDPVQLQQALVNLAINGRDAMPQGGTLTLETSRVEIQDADASPDIPVGSYASLVVEDTGTGIDPAILPKIFEPFFTTKPVSKGTGLGLSMVYGMVRQSGGQISVSSRMGQGARFTILLPSAPATSQAEVQDEPGPGMESEKGGLESILLVEDETMVLTYLTTVLHSKGYRVHAFGNPVKALEWLSAQATSPDLLLTDVVMEGLNGVALSEKAGEIHPGLKTIFMSGYNDDEILKYGIRENQVPFLQKPFSPMILLEKLRQVLESRSTPI